MSTEMGFQQVRDLSHTEASKMQMIFSYWGKWQTLKHHLCIFCNISWKWWELSSFIHALTRDIWRRTKSCRKGWVMRSQGKMVCHAVRWCFWYFTVIQHYSPLCSSKNACCGGRTACFPQTPFRAGVVLTSLTFPSALLENTNPTAFLPSHFCNEMQNFSISISPKKPSKGEIHALLEANTRELHPKHSLKAGRQRGASPWGHSSHNHRWSGLTSCCHQCHKVPARQINHLPHQHFVQSCILFTYGVFRQV